MTILLYDYRELQERPPRHLKAWKAWHLIMYVFAVVFGIANYVFLQYTMALVDDHCVLFPRELEFHVVELTDAQIQDFYKMNHEFTKNITDYAQPDVYNATESSEKLKRDTEDNETIDVNDVATMEQNVTTTTGNKTHRLALDTSRSLFEANTDCMFAEYMPIMSTVFALLWVTMFTMCPSGGHARTGLTQPWRILAPALLFSLVMVGLTGHSFTLTNGGMHAFCQAFSNITNSTTCSAAAPYVERNWDAAAWWGLGARAGLARAASAGACGAWACAAALLLARCLAAPDFVVRRTSVYLKHDPQQKIIPYLKKSHKVLRSNQSSPMKGDNASIRSEPTITTELVTASIEQGDYLATAPTSLLVTPVKNSTPRQSENIEMAYTTQERLESQQ